MASILIVDDDQGLRDILGDVLEGKGHDCVVASAMARAKETATEGSFELAIVDLTLGEGESGAELARWLAEHCAGMPIVCISGHLIDLDEGHLEEVGFTHFLPKPFELERLSSVVDTALGVEA